jgi:peptidoglycan/xylan/chitin deacetylase (PgdA/CDA1 family)
MVSSICALAATVALTFDDLPLNGELPAGTTRVQLVQKVVTILDKHPVPPVYGFVNGKRLEGSRDGSDALKAWVAAGELVGNHTYSLLISTRRRARFFFWTSTRTSLYSNS